MSKLNSKPAEGLTQMDVLVKRRGEINRRIEEISNAISLNMAKQSELQTAIRDLQNNLQRIPQKNPAYADKRQRMGADLQQARQDFSQAEDGYKQLEEELRQLQIVELPSCMVALRAEDVAEHQLNIKLANSHISSIQAAIDSQNQFIANTRAAIPKEVDRQQERHNIMADIALGTASDSDLKALDSVISKDKEKVSATENKAAPLIANAQAALSGLKRKLAAAQDELKLLESKSSEVAHRYFMGEAEKAAAQYVNNALHMKELYLRLIGLNRVILQYDKRGFTLPSAGEIKIPMFHLPQFEGLFDPKKGDWMLLDGARITNARVIQAAEAEKIQFDNILNGRT